MLQCTFGYYIVFLYFGKKHSQYLLLINNTKCKILYRKTLAKNPEINSDSPVKIARVNTWPVYPDLM